MDLSIDEYSLLVAKPLAEIRFSENEWMGTVTSTDKNVILLVLSDNFVVIVVGGAVTACRDVALEQGKSAGQAG